MLRTIFVLLIVAFGLRHALRGPFYALLFYLWVAYFRPEGWVWDGLVQSLNLSLITGGLVVLLAVVTGQAFRLSTRGLLLFLFLADSLVCTMASPYFHYGWPYWTDFLKSTAIAYLIAVLATDLSRIRLVFLVIALSLGFEATKEGWGQLVFAPGEKNWNSIIFLGDNNGAAVGMFMLAPMIVALLQTTKNKWARLGLVVMLFGVLYRGISTYSRGGFLACIVMGLFYLLRSKHKVRTFLVVGTLALLIAPVLSTAYWERIGSIRLPTEGQEYTRETSADDTSTLGRIHFWRVALQMAWQRPLTGVGHNSYVPAYDDYDNTNGLFGRQRSVHSSWLGLLAELGFPGFLIFLTNFLLAIFTSWRIRRMAKADPDMADLLPYATAIEMGLVVFAVGGAFVIFQYTEMLWHFLGLSIALGRIVSVRVRAREEALRSRPVPMRTASLANGAA